MVVDAPVASYNRRPKSDRTKGKNIVNRIFKEFNARASQNSDSNLGKLM